MCDVDIHDAYCVTCKVRFQCSDPLCDGYHVCPDCLFPLELEDIERVQKEVERL